jgi:penicillin-binding protein 1A
LKTFLAGVGLLLALIIGCVIGAVAILSQGLPEVMALEDFSPPSSTIIMASDSSVIGEIALERRTPVTLDKVPPDLVRAILAIEDHRYFDHIGINFLRIAKALAVDIIEGEAVQGGSTITQQLAKMLFLTPEKTVKRKVREAILAFEIEKMYTKEEILALYLNQIYLGNGAYGVAAAAKVYFDKPIEKLNLEECALIAALPKAPGKFDPFRHPELAIERRNLVLSRMLELGWIDENAYKEAVVKTIPQKSPESRMKDASFFVEAVRKELVEKLGHKLVYQGGLRVYTTLDAAIQHAAEKALLAGILEIEGRNQRLRQKTPLEGAVVLIDVKTGAVLAHSGGRDWYRNQFDRVMQAKRQMGSTFKPFVYAAAMELNIPQSRTIVDAPVSYPGGTAGEPWQPQNYDREYKGRMTLRKALALSRNIPAIKMLDEVGIPAVTSMTKRLGLTTAMGEGLASALGVGAASLEQMTTAYATFASGGLRPEPYRIRAVYGPDGRNLWGEPPFSRRAIDPRTAFLTSDILAGVVESGTGRKAASLPFPVAGKTGTTDDQRDASFIGFSSQFALGVWMGRDDNTPIGIGETGTRAALPVWVEVMSAVGQKYPPPPRTAPEDIEFAEIDLDTGLLAGPGCKETAMVAFAPETKPKERCRR